MAKIIAQETIDDILASCDLVQLVSEYLPLPKRSGQNYYGLCPFHQEKSPSFAVSNERKRYHCFGCHADGDAINFVMQMERLDFPEACEFLAKKLGINVQYKGGQIDHKKELKSKQKLIHLEAARFFYKHLISKDGKPALDYLTRVRGLSSSTIKRFGLGSSPISRTALTDHLIAKGISQEEILSAGLARSGTRGLNDLFRGRIVFPVFDLKGSIVAFGGRVMDDGLPKYVNSPETDIFKKGRELYAFNFAKLSKSKRVILCEGYLDVLALYEAGFDNVVAGLGTAFTLDQAKLLMRLKKPIVLCYDSDRAGIKAALSALNLLEANGAEVYAARLPAGLDPDDYIKKHGRERFKAVLDTALGGLDFKLTLARESKTSPDGVFDLLAYSEEACRLIATYPNKVQQEIYAGRLAKEIKVSAAAVMSQVKQAASRLREAEDKTYRPPAETGMNNPEQLISRSELIILCALVFGRLNHDDYEIIFNLDLYANSVVKGFLAGLKEEFSDQVQSEDKGLSGQIYSGLKLLNSAQLLARASSYSLGELGLDQVLSAQEATEFSKLGLENDLGAEASYELGNLSAARSRDKRESLVEAAIKSQDANSRAEKLRQIQAADLANLSRYRKNKHQDDQANPR